LSESALDAAEIISTGRTDQYGTWLTLFTMTWRLLFFSSIITMTVLMDAGATPSF
jgi:hypothetical protein